MVVVDATVVVGAAVVVVVACVVVVVGAAVVVVVACVVVVVGAAVVVVVACVVVVVGAAVVVVVACVVVVVGAAVVVVVACVVVVVGAAVVVVVACAVVVVGAAVVVVEREPTTEVVVLVPRCRLCGRGTSPKVRGYPAEGPEGLSPRVPACEHQLGRLGTHGPCGAKCEHPPVSSGPAVPCHPERGQCRQRARRAGTCSSTRSTQRRRRPRPHPW